MARERAEFAEPSEGGGRKSQNSRSREKGSVRSGVAVEGVRTAESAAILRWCGVARARNQQMAGEHQEHQTQRSRLRKREGPAVKRRAGKTKRSASRTGDVTPHPAKKSKNADPGENPGRSDPGRWTASSCGGVSTGQSVVSGEAGGGSLPRRQLQFIVIAHLNNGIQWGFLRCVQPCGSHAGTHNTKLELCTGQHNP